MTPERASDILLQALKNVRALNVTGDAASKTLCSVKFTVDVPHWDLPDFLAAWGSHAGRVAVVQSIESIPPTETEPGHLGQTVVKR